MKKFILLFVLVSCKPTTTPSQDAEAGTQVVNDVCQMIAGPTRNICATVEEIAQIVIPFILTLRADDAGVAAQSTCTILPKTQFCATGKEIDQSILFLVKARSARLMMDGGK